MNTLRHICSEIIFQDEDGLYHGRFDRACMEQPITACPLCGEVLEEGWFRELYRVEPMTRQMMESTVRSKACSNCWQYRLVAHDVTVPILDEAGEETGEVENLYLVLCALCMEETVGYVSSRYIGKARERDFVTWRTVYMNLESVIGIAQAPEERKAHTREENLHALGF